MIRGSEESNDQLEWKGALDGQN